MSTLKIENAISRIEPDRWLYSVPKDGPNSLEIKYPLHFYKFPLNIQ
jgi:hypothetical protein